jgi:hypothetical protein
VRTHEKSEEKLLGGFFQKKIITMMQCVRSRPTVRVFSVLVVDVRLLCQRNVYVFVAEVVVVVFGWLVVCVGDLIRSPDLKKRFRIEGDV